MRERIRYWLMILVCSLVGVIWVSYLYTTSFLGLLFMLIYGWQSGFGLPPTFGIPILLSLLPPFIAGWVGYSMTKSKQDGFLAFIIVFLLEIWPVYFILYLRLFDKGFG